MNVVVYRKNKHGGGKMMEQEKNLKKDKILIGWKKDSFRPIEKMQEEKKLESIAKKFLGGKMPEELSCGKTFPILCLEDIEEIKKALELMEEYPILMGVFSHTLYSAFAYYDSNKNNQDCVPLCLVAKDISIAEDVADIFCHVLSNNFQNSPLVLDVKSKNLGNYLKELKVCSDVPVIFIKNGEIRSEDKKKIDRILQKEELKLVPIYVNKTKLKGTWGAELNKVELPRTIAEKKRLKSAIHTMMYLFLWNLESDISNKNGMMEKSLEQYGGRELTEEEFCQICYRAFSFLLRGIESATKNILTDDDEALLERIKEKAKYLLLNENGDGEKVEELTDKEYISNLYDFIQEELKKNESLINKAKAVVLCQPGTGKQFEENEEYYWLKTKTYAGAFLEYMKKEKEYPGKVGELAESVREALKNNELIKWDNNNISWSRWKYGEKNSYIMLNKEKFDKFVAKENQ